MKSYYLILVVIALAVLNACQKECTLEYIEGEALMLPIQFKNFPKNSYSSIRVYKTLDSSHKIIDSFQMERILFLLNDTTGSNYLVDHNKYPSHQSPWNNCDLIFNWGAGHSDTLKNFDIRYSRFEDRKECHEDDPYVRIDKVEYYHKNKKMGKNDKIIIEF